MITWTSLYQDGSHRGVYAQEYDVTGARLGDEVMINTTTFLDQESSSVAMKGESGFVVAWSGRGDGDSNGVFTRSFARPDFAPAVAPLAMAAFHPNVVDEIMSDDNEDLTPDTTLF